MAASTVGPLIKAITGPSCRPVVRSHSHTLSRAGRPRLERKPSGRLTPESGSDAVRVPSGTPGIRETEPVARWMASYSTSAGSRRANACA